MWGCYVAKRSQRIRSMDNPTTAQATLDIVQLMPNRYEVRMAGEFGEADAEQLSVRFQAAMGESMPKSLQIIMDLTAMQACSVAARDVLCEFQKSLAGLGARTTYVANKPRLRGVGLWVAHNSKDRNVRAVHNKAQAEKWLNDDKSRLESVATRLGLARQ